MEDKKPASFEENLTRLEEIVRALEAGTAPLDKSLTLFEEGASIVRQCQNLLDNAEQKVVKLSKGENGEPVESPFEAE